MGDLAVWPKVDAEANCIDYLGNGRFWVAVFYLPYISRAFRDWSDLYLVHYISPGDDCVILGSQRPSARNLTRRVISE